MAKEWAKEIYNSTQWINTRKAYYESQHGLCERCGNAGELVHHRIYLTAENINNPEIVYGWDNLELLCRNCHAQEHGIQITEDGLMFNENGDIEYENKDYI